jgi:hypothetical protein
MGQLSKSLWVRASALNPLGQAELWREAAAHQ